ncbi:MAG: hypothetical protein E7316_10760 [Clostridiales bacterium]|nr:hypothetical protein [Clostridiales bacterium]
MPYAAVILLAAVGVLFAFKPSLCWDLTERWKSNGTKPSEDYLHSVRIKGGLYIGVAVLFLLVLISLN